MSLHIDTQGRVWPSLLHAEAASVLRPMAVTLPTPIPASAHGTREAPSGQFHSFLEGLPMDMAPNQSPEGH